MSDDPLRELLSFGPAPTIKKQPKRHPGKAWVNVNDGRRVGMSRVGRVRTFKFTVIGHGGQVSTGYGEAVTNWEEAYVLAELLDGDGWELESSEA